MARKEMGMDKNDEKWMRLALAEAEQAKSEGEVPVGAVVVCNGRIIGRGHNMTERLNDVTAHAEMLAITAAAQTLGGKYLPDCTLYVTVEPCAMCAGAIGWSQIRRLVYGTSDPKRGFHSRFNPEGLLPSPLHPKTEIASGILAEEAALLMSEFFKSRR